MKYLLILCLISACTHASYKYDKAAYIAQKGEWQQVYEQLSSLLVDNHDHADLLYDAGIAATHLGQHEQACAYFSQSAHYADNDTLKIRALFNAGNACVNLKHLQEALEKYEAVLSLDRNDEYARHNRDKVREMLEQQKQQEERDNQQNEDQQEQNQQDKKEQNQQQADKNNSDQKKDGQSGTNEQDQRDQQKSEEQSNDKESRDGADNSNNSDKGKEQRNKQKEREQSQQDKQRDGEQNVENKANQKQDKRNGQQRENHDTSPQKNSNQDTTVPSDMSKEQEQSGGDPVGGAQHQGQEEIEQAFAEKMNNPLLAKILEQQEAKDKAMNKQLMEAKMRQSGGGNDTYNNW